MNTPMTLEEFEKARVSFGDELSVWPQLERMQAEAFLLTKEGLLAQKTEQLLDQHLSNAGGGDQHAEAFLNRLLDVPANYAQESLSAVGKERTSETLASLMRDLRDMFSPLGLFTPGAAYALIFGLGIFVGLQTHQETLSLDLSSIFFEDDSDYYVGEH